MSQSVFRKSSSPPMTGAGAQMDIRDVKGYVNVIVLGASGDLASRKIYPALFSLYANGHLPHKHIHFTGYARSKLDPEKFMEKVCAFIKPKTEAEKKMIKDFKDRQSYISGQYDTDEGFQALNKHLLSKEKNQPGHRMFYFSLPPSVFLDVAKHVGSVCSSKTGFTRVVIEKPFGRDGPSSAELGEGLAEHFDEDQMYRIDHYLGKELVQNVMVLRFANLIFEPIWNAQHIASVTIRFKEELGVEGRGGYFDNYGIMRDVMQNHLVQIMALIAMETPATLAAEDIRAEKTKVLRCVEALTMKNLVVGQYRGKGNVPAYTDDPSVPKGSLTPTFAAAVCYIRNRRWDGVPFMLKCGKGLDERLAEVRIRFKKVPGQMFSDEMANGSGLSCNELVLRLQPGEAIYMRTLTKIPGLKMQLASTNLNLSYKEAFEDAKIPDAYERLVLDVLNGDHSLFIGAEELKASWDIFTPVLFELERRKIKPEKYVYGGHGPAAAEQLAAQHNINCSEE